MAVCWRLCGPLSALRCHQEKLLFVTALNTTQVLLFSFKRAGDKGPQKNYDRKLKKKTSAKFSKKLFLKEGLLDNLEKSESLIKEPSSQQQSQSENLVKILSDMRIYVPTDDDIRRKLGMPTKQNKSSDAPIPSVTSAKKTRLSLSFTQGSRLDIFQKPSSTTEVMPPERWAFSKEDETKQIDALNKLRPTNNMFLKLMEDSQDMWQYPIDNEAGRIEEEEVGFEEHIFMMDLLDDDRLPKKGPVRHFMELVATGLSKNPYYTPSEKRDHIEWFKTYLSQFPPEELEAQFTQREK